MPERFCRRHISAFISRRRRRQPPRRHYWLMLTDIAALPLRWLSPLLPFRQLSEWIDISFADATMRH